MLSSVYLHCCFFLVQDQDDRDLVGVVCMCVLYPATHYIWSNGTLRSYLRLALLHQGIARTIDRDWVTALCVLYALITPVTDVVGD